MFGWVVHPKRQKGDLGMPVQGIGRLIGVPILFPG